MKESELRGRFAAARIARLATVRPDGSPHVVPVCFAMLDDATIVSAVDDVKPKRSTSLARLDNVRATPRASMIVDEYDDSDWAALWWVRADGVARVVETGADYDAAVAALVTKYLQYAAHPPAGPAIIVSVTRWATWSHDQRGRVRRGG